jgi:hypothetical protein
MRGPINGCLWNGQAPEVESWTHRAGKTQTHLLGTQEDSAMAIRRLCVWRGKPLQCYLWVPDRVLGHPIRPAGEDGASGKSPKVESPSLNVEYSGPPPTGVTVCDLQRMPGTTDSSAPYITVSSCMTSNAATLPELTCASVFCALGPPWHHYSCTLGHDEVKWGYPNTAPRIPRDDLITEWQLSDP